MKTTYLAAGALALVAAPAAAQHQHMPGMTMPADNKPPIPDKPVQPPMDHSMSEHAAHRMKMTGALGPYAIERESSGTAWQPDSSEHEGLHAMSGNWMLMAHGTMNLVFDHQSGPRGDDKAFASGMLMGMARRPLGDGTLQLKAMVSPDPLMGKRGYPLLLASGETANGRDRLIDRQHPHDFFMELSASVSQNIGPKSSVFLYAGLPGEPAFGPPAFMHREAIIDTPEAPITHHWLEFDPHHVRRGDGRIGARRGEDRSQPLQRPRARPAPLEHRDGSARLDGDARLLEPARTLALQGSWGHFTDPEQLEPGIDQKRWSASALWADEIVPGWKAAATLAWGRKSAHGHKDDAVAVEASLKHAQWTLFGRGEVTENRELLDIHDGPAFRVGKVSAGAIRDFRVGNHLSLGAGGLVSLNFVPEGLAPIYGGHNPTGAMAFVRLKLD